MIVNNNPFSNDQDDLRDDDLSYENTTGSNADNSSDEEDDFDKEDDLEDDDDIDEDEGVDDANEDTSRSITNTYPGEKKEDRPDEIPEKHESEHEGSGYPHETEYRQPARSSDASYSEQIDVTPPNPHEVPSVGNAETDFVSRPYRRRTARMVGHEPGTESI